MQGPALKSRDHRCWRRCPTPSQGETVEAVQRQGHWLQIEWLSVGSYVDGWVSIFEPNTKARIMRQVCSVAAWRCDCTCAALSTERFPCSQIVNQTHLQSNELV